MDLMGNKRESVVNTDTRALANKQKTVHYYNTVNIDFGGFEYTKIQNTIFDDQLITQKPVILSLTQ